MPKRKARGPASRKAKLGKREERGGNRYAHCKRGFTEYHTTPYYMQQPKRGFNTKFWRAPLVPLWLPILVRAIEAGKINPKKTITMKRIYDESISRSKHGYKLMCGPECPDVFPYRIRIQCIRASPAARKCIESAGGVIEQKFFNRESLRVYNKPQMIEFLPKYYDNLPEQFRRHKFPDYPQLPSNPMVLHAPERYQAKFAPLRPTAESKVYEKPA